MIIYKRFERFSKLIEGETMEISVTVSYYIPQNLKERIENEAKALDRSASWLVANVLSKYFQQSDHSGAEKPDTGGNGRAAGNIGA
jgi:hypothetical protein